jgi:hypothetical protein
MQYVDPFKMLEDFCQELYEETVHVSASPSADVLVRDVFFVLLAKARTLLNSIVILHRSAQYPSVTVLLRSLLELHIQMKWISEKDLIGLCTRYAELANVARMRTFLRTKRNWREFASSCEDKEFRQRYEENTEKAKRYGYRNVMDVGNWRPIKSDDKRYSILDMAKDVLMEYEYRVVYNRLCETTHIGPGSDLDYEVVPQGRGLIPRKPLSPTELAIAASHFLDIYALANKAMGQSFREVTFQRLRYEKTFRMAFGASDPKR